jgi:cellulose synthase/poly-beta-1,6-N-acetylglucosamine synthase-like glycosyltransferase
MTPGELLHAAWTWSPAFSALASSIAATMTVINLGVYRRAAPLGVQGQGARPTVSVCVPARNEERNIEAIVRCALANQAVDVEVLVYDDQSTDGTPGILESLRREDARVRPVPTQPLPEGWNGKQWGCERMGRAARTEWLLFTDADVRLAPDCLGRAVAEARRLDAALLSTIPREETGSPLERLVVPLIHWMLFSWLPMPRMRTTNDPATSAGCGQFLLVRRDAWEAAGGHAAFRDSMHDGIKLPRNVRRAGFHTDLYDGGESVSCRMYRNAGETWRGFTKNAYEGLGSPVVLAVFTLLEAAGILLPWVWLPIAIARGETPLGPTVLASFAVAAQLFQRTILARRFAQPWECVALHPVTIALLLAIQWRSWWLHLTKRRAWRGRTA